MCERDSGINTPESFDNVMSNEQNNCVRIQMGNDPCSALKELRNQVAQLIVIACQAERICKERRDPYNLAPSTSFDQLEVFLHQGGYLK